jgi:hypothetical protein
MTDYNPKRYIYKDGWIVAADLKGDGSYRSLKDGSEYRPGNNEFFDPQASLQAQQPVAPLQGGPLPAPPPMPTVATNPSSPMSVAPPLAPAGPAMQTDGETPLLPKTAPTQKQLQDIQTVQNLYKNSPYSGGPMYTTEEDIAASRSKIRNRDQRIVLEDQANPFFGSGTGHIDGRAQEEAARQLAQLPPTAPLQARPAPTPMQTQPPRSRPTPAMTQQSRAQPVSQQARPQPARTNRVGGK